MVIEQRRVSSHILIILYRFFITCCCCYSHSYLRLLLLQIHLFFRIMPYSGGWHMFADGSSVFHADYVSGWDEDFLQNLLDTCQNDGDEIGRAHV